MILILAWIVLIGFWLITRFYAFPEFFIYPYLEASGFLPYKQIIDQHFPGAIFWPINLFRLGIDAPLELKYFSLGLIVIESLLIFLVSRKYLGRVVAGMAVWSFTFWQTILSGNKLWFESFAALPIFLSFVLTLANRWFLAGFFLGFAILFKQTIAVLAIVLSINLIWKRRQWQNIIHFGGGGR